ncbi:DNA polymerase beta superfamily protein [Streptomyces thermolineatus]|uniref:nucleotidyltransferase domain-containing protein n=1 Tax=Streptomyces thermolineatus TaxID=44033 RepID=UPI00384C9DAD
MTAAHTANTANAMSAASTASTAVGGAAGAGGPAGAVTGVLLSGIVGSTAYGLAHAGSDTDRLGVFAAPTSAFHGLHRPAESHVTTDPDTTYHEAAKWCRLALGCNPTASELVWLPGELYEVRTALGDDLIALRGRFLSARRVRDAYLGYAGQQFRRLRERGGGPSSGRAAKHARHLVRLLEQGTRLHLTGHLEIRLEDPGRVREDGERIAADPDLGLEFLSRAEEVFDRPGVLPPAPDEPAVEAWLQRVRAAHWDGPPAGRP